MIKQSADIGQLRRDNELLARTIKNMKVEQEKIRTFSGDIDLKNVGSKAVGNEEVDSVLEE